MGGGGDIEYTFTSIPTCTVNIDPTVWVAPFEGETSPKLVKEIREISFHKTYTVFQKHQSIPAAMGGGGGGAQG